MDELLALMTLLPERVAEVSNLRSTVSKLHVDESESELSKLQSERDLLQQELASTRSRLLATDEAQKAMRTRLLSSERARDECLTACEECLAERDKVNNVLNDRLAKVQMENAL